MHPRASLPLDIAENIIDNIGKLPHNQETVATLKALCLTCKDYVDRTRHYLFKSIEFTYRHEFNSGRIRSRFQLLKSAIERSPRLASHHIRGLSLIDRNEQRYIFDPQSLEIIIGLFHLLPNITSFGFRLINVSKSNNIMWSWGNIGPSFQAILSKFFFRSSNTSLCIENLWDLPVSFVVLCTRVTSVKLMNVSFAPIHTTDIEDAVEVFQVPNSKLENLQLGTSRYNFLKPLIDQLSYYSDSNIEAFHIMQYEDFTGWKPDYRYEIAQKIMESNSNSILELSWTAPLRMYTPSFYPITIATAFLDQVLDLGILSNLRTIMISANMRELGSWETLDNIVRTLRTASYANKINKVDLSLTNVGFLEKKVLLQSEATVQTPSPTHITNTRPNQLNRRPYKCGMAMSRRMPAPSPEPKWEDLDKLLTDPMFSELRVVGFHFKFTKVEVDTYYRDNEKVIKNALRKVFPLMYERGLIRII